MSYDLDYYLPSKKGLGGKYCDSVFGLGGIFSHSLYRTNISTYTLRAGSCLTLSSLLCGVIPSSL